jgi:hypothetical protein
MKRMVIALSFSALLAGCYTPRDAAHGWAPSVFDPVLTIVFVAISLGFAAFLYLRNRKWRAEAPARAAAAAAAAEAERRRIASLPLLSAEERKARVGLEADASVRQGWKMVGYESDGFGAIFGKVVGGVDGCLLLILLLLGIIPGILYLLVSGKHEERRLLRMDERGIPTYTALGKFKI